MAKPEVAIRLQTLCVGVLSDDKAKDLTIWLNFHKGLSSPDPEFSPFIEDFFPPDVGPLPDELQTAYRAAGELAIFSQAVIGGARFFSEWLTLPSELQQEAIDTVRYTIRLKYETHWGMCSIRQKLGGWVGFFAEWATDHPKSEQRDNSSTQDDERGKGRPNNKQRDTLRRVCLLLIRDFLLCSQKLQTCIQYFRQRLRGELIRVADTGSEAKFGTTTAHETAFKLAERVFATIATSVPQPYSLFCDRIEDPPVIRLHLEKLEKMKNIDGLWMVLAAETSPDVHAIVNACAIEIVKAASARTPNNPPMLPPVKKRMKKHSRLRQPQVPQEYKKPLKLWQEFQKLKKNLGKRPTFKEFFSWLRTTYGVSLDEETFRKWWNTYTRTKRRAKKRG